MTVIDAIPNHPPVSGWTLSPERQEILDHADRFARNELYPLQQRMDDEEWWPPQVMPRLGEMGFLGVTAPAELGGAESDLFASGLIAQGLARWNHAISLSYVAHENLCLNNILRNADAAVKARVLPGLCAGTKIGALGFAGEFRDQRLRQRGFHRRVEPVPDLIDTAHRASLPRSAGTRPHR